MEDAVAEILAAEASDERLLTGVDIGAREVFNVPDVLYAKALWMRDR